MKEYRCFGPPGTGKTTYLSRQIAKAVEATHPSDVLVCSFTKAAVHELNTRNLPIPDSNIGTLHAIAYRALGNPNICENKDGFKAFCDASGWEIGGATREDVDDGYATCGNDGHDAIFSSMQAKRARLIPPEMWTPAEQRLWQSWQEFKTDTGQCDFTDLIDDALKYTYEAPGSPTVGFFDECFPGDIKITMADGSQKPIRQIVNGRIGESILSFNIATESVEVKKIIGWYKTPLRSRKILSAGGLRATEDHPIFTKDRNYYPFKKCIDLGCTQVLYLRYEDIQPNREAIGRGTVHYSRVASWRRFDLQEPGNGDKCQSQIHSRNQASPLPGLEISTSQEVGKVSPYSPNQDSLWWGSLLFCDGKPSPFYEILEYVIHVPWRQEISCQEILRGISFPYNRFIPGSMVYGRREQQSILRHTPYSFIVERGLTQNPRLLLEATDALRYIPYKQGEYYRLYFGRSKDAFFDYLSACPFYFRLQNQLSSTQGGCRYSHSHSFPKGELPELYYMRNGVPLQQRSKDLSQQGMLSHPQEPVGGSVEGEEEGWVYCIDVEDNHNFFANGILVHNCQDFTPLELRLVRHWGDRMETFTMAGDDDQSIYSFKGVTPTALLHPPLPADRIRILKKSYRVPAAIHTKVNGYIHQIHKDWRQEKEYLPRDYEGQIIRTRSTYKSPSEVLALALEYTELGKTVLWLTSCSYMLHTLIKILRSRGIPFSNPYRRRRGDWNPLHNRKNQQSLAHAVASFMNMDERACDFWYGKELKQWSKLVKGAFLRGSKDRIENLRNEEMINLASLGHYMDSDSARAATGENQMAWLKDNLLAKWQKSAEYVFKVAEKGSFWLTYEPLMRLGTVHSVKGGEADVVILFPDVSPQALNNPTIIQGNNYHQEPMQNSLIRQFYVGMTRAKEVLIIGSPSSVFCVTL